MICGRFVNKLYLFHKPVTHRIDVHRDTISSTTTSIIITLEIAARDVGHLHVGSKGALDQGRGRGSVRYQGREQLGESSILIYPGTSTHRTKLVRHPHPLLDRLRLLVLTKLTATWHRPLITRVSLRDIYNRKRRCRCVRVCVSVSVCARVCMCACAGLRV